MITSPTYNIFSCSCRENGNTSFCANLIQQHFSVNEVFYPCKTSLQHCIGCGYCDTHKGQCIHTTKHIDTVYHFYQKIFQVQHVIFIIPIYFYHVPAPLKAFIDRSQAWFSTPQEEKPAQNTQVKIIFIGAREKGEKLFEGAYLSMKYAMLSIGAKIHTPLNLYGLDHKTDLQNNIDKQNQIIEYLKQC